MVKHALENAQEIDCRTNRQLLFRYLDLYTGNKAGGWPSPDEDWQIFRHMESCYDPICQRLNEISIWDKYLTGQEMKREYGREIEISMIASKS